MKEKLPANTKFQTPTPLKLEENRVKFSQETWSQVSVIYNALYNLIRNTDFSDSRPRSFPRKNRLQAGPDRVCFEGTARKPKPGDYKNSKKSPIFYLNTSQMQLWNGSRPTLLNNFIIPLNEERKSDNRKVAAISLSKNRLRVLLLFFLLSLHSA